MSKLRIFLIAVTYLGIVIALFGAILAFRYSIFDFTQHVLSNYENPTHQVFEESADPHRFPIWYEIKWEIPLIITGVGTFLTLIGGFMVRLRYLGLRLTILGTISILSFSGLFYFAFGFYYGIGIKLTLIPRLLLFLLPGLACIIGGIKLHRILAKS